MYHQAVFFQGIVLAPAHFHMWISQNVLRYWMCSSIKYTTGCPYFILKQKMPCGRTVNYDSQTRRRLNDRSVFAQSTNSPLLGRSRRRRWRRGKTWWWWWWWEDISHTPTKENTNHAWRESWISHCVHTQQAGQRSGKKKAQCRPKDAPISFHRVKY